MLRTSPAVGEKEAVRKIRDLLLALHYLHRKGIIHRKGTPASLFLCGADNDNDCAPSKYGSATLGKSESSATGDVAQTVYSAPEMEGNGPYGPQADMWSTGSILAEMLSGVKPKKSYREYSVFLHNVS